MDCKFCQIVAGERPAHPVLDTEDVVGKVFMLLWPSDRFKILHRPDTFADVPDAK